MGTGACRDAFVRPGYKMLRQAVGCRLGVVPRLRYRSLDLAGHYGMYVCTFAVGWELATRTHCAPESFPEGHRPRQADETACNARNACFTPQTLAYEADTPLCSHMPSQGQYQRILVIIPDCLHSWHVIAYHWHGLSDSRHPYDHSSDSRAVPCSLV